MGCGASTEVIDLTAVNARMTSAYGMVNENRIGCLMQQLFWSFSGGDFPIRDHLGEVLFNVKGNREGNTLSLRGDLLRMRGDVLSLRKKMQITDKAGAKIAVMQKTLHAGPLQRSSFYMYTYKPNFDRDFVQASMETDSDGEALYRYAFLEARTSRSKIFQVKKTIRGC